MENIQSSDASYTDDTATPNIESAPFSSVAKKEGIDSVEPPERGRTCCRCFPLIPGVYILIFIYLMFGVFALVNGALGLLKGDSISLYAVLIAYGINAFLLLPVGLVGLCKRNAQLFVMAPVFLVFSCISNVVTITMGFLLPNNASESSKDSQTVGKKMDGSKLSEPLALTLGFGFLVYFLLGFYYSYIMIRMYIVLKRRSKQDK